MEEEKIQEKSEETEEPSQEEIPREDLETTPPETNSTEQVNAKAKAKRKAKAKEAAKPQEEIDLQRQSAACADMTKKPRSQLPLSYRECNDPDASILATASYVEDILSYHHGNKSQRIEPHEHEDERFASYISIYRESSEDDRTIRGVLAEKECWDHTGRQNLLDFMVPHQACTDH